MWYMTRDFYKRNKPSPIINSISQMTACVLITVFCSVPGASSQAADENPIRIMPLGDSITAGYTDNPKWEHPFEFGYRSSLYSRMKNAKYDFLFVGESKEPFTMKSGDPSKNGLVFPKLDLRQVNQDNHRGYGGWGITQIQKNVAEWITQDRPNIILLLIGINGINAKSPQQLDSLVKTIYETDNNVKLIVAQITPLSTFNQDLFDYNTYIRQILVPTYTGKGYIISTVDLYKHFLNDQNDPRSIDATSLSNRINHPTNALYDKMADSWFQGIELMLKNNKPDSRMTADGTLEKMKQ